MDERLINYAYKKCNMITMGFYIHNNSNYEKFNKKVRQLQTELVTNYPNSFIAKKEEYYWLTQIKHNYDTYFFQFSKELKDYLLINKNLYNWNNPEFPTDIGFFKDGKCWLRAVPHEHMCDIFVENEKEYNHLKKIGLEFLEGNYRIIFEDEIQIENI